MKDSELTKYMSDSIERLLSDAFKSTIKNPRETAFLSKYTLSSKKAIRTREKYEKAGIHIPPFLISSITTDCNLFCTGCYARANHICCEKKQEEESETILSGGRWAEIFEEADKLGISFILLAGGEPFLYKEVIEKAASLHNIIFPIFTNGTLLDGDAADLLNRSRNLLPVISLEGNEKRTDDRRGQGTYDKVDSTMKRMQEKKILYGVSITVTSENLTEASSDAFIEKLFAKGCRIVFFIEYVPVSPGSDHLSLNGETRMALEKRQDALRTEFKEIIFLSFPGDEKFTGGCLAAGRGFFHINPYGHAEPCPFSPHSDISMKTNSLLDALRSPLFAKLRQCNLVGGEHDGGCSLFAHEEQVKELCDKKTNNESIR